MESVSVAKTTRVKDTTLKETTQLRIIATYPRSGNTLQEGLKYIRDRKFRLPTLGEEIELRVQDGLESDHFIHGTYIKEAVLVLPDKRFYMTSDSPLLEDSFDPTHLFTPTKKTIEEILAKGYRVKKDQAIPVDCLGSDDLSKRFFGQFVSVYGELLEEIGIKQIEIILPVPEKQPFVNQLYLNGLFLDSAIDASIYPYDSCMMHGIKRIRSRIPGR